MTTDDPTPLTAARRRPARRSSAQAAEPVSPAAPPVAPAAPLPEDLVAEAVEVSGSPVGRIEATDVAVTKSLVGLARADRVSVEMGALGAALADEVSVSQGTVSSVLAREVRVEQAFVRTMVAQEIRVERSTGVLVLLAGRVSGDVRALLDWRGALAFGAAFGLVAALFRRRGDRG